MRRARRSVRRLRVMSWRSPLKRDEPIIPKAGHQADQATGFNTRAQLADQLKELQAENARLKRIVADQMLDIDALKEINSTNWSSP